MVYPHSHVIPERLNTSYPSEYTEEKEVKPEANEKGKHSTDSHMYH